MEKFLIWIPFVFLCVMMIAIIIMKLRSDKRSKEEDQSSQFEDPNNRIAAENCSGTTPGGDFRNSKKNGFKPRKC